MRFAVRLPESGDPGSLERPQLRRVAVDYIFLANVALVGPFNAIIHSAGCGH